MISIFNQKIGNYLGPNLHEKSRPININSLFVDPNHLDFVDIKFSFKNWQNTNIDRSVFIFRTKTDYSLAVYPLTLLVTNKMANTFISRQSSGNALKDFSLIRNCTPQGLLLGFVPYACYSFWSQVNWYSYERKNN